MATRKTSGSKLAEADLVGKALIADIRRLVAEARAHVATAANATLTLLYWRIGRRVHADVLTGDRAAYGEHIVVSLSRQLETGYGSSFGEKNLRRMIQFAQVFPDEKIVVSLIRELSWTHFLALLPLKEPLQREFYAEMCRAQRWSVRTLRDKIGGMLYERTALSRKPAELARMELAALRDEDRVSTDLVLRDPYLLDFLGLKDTDQEKDLEAAILREMERFILKLGSGFAFLARQKRITVDDEDFYLGAHFCWRHSLLVVDHRLPTFARKLRTIDHRLRTFGRRLRTDDRMNTSTLVQKLWNYCNGPRLGQTIAGATAREQAGAREQSRLTLRRDDK